MPWIENVSMADASRAFHHDCGPNSMLIRIHDPAFVPLPLVRPKMFREIHSFEFLDIEENGLTNLGDGQLSDMAEFGPMPHHAKELVRLLRHAKENRMNVVVHCHAGLCRSGAVAEVGIMMGFDEVHTRRIPNTLLKTMMMRELGWTYD